MNVIRAVGIIGLALLAVLAAVMIFISVYEGNWWTVFIGIGFFVIIAFFADALRIEAFKRRHSEASIAPNKTIFFAFCLIGGIGLLISAASALVQASWWTAIIHMLLGGTLLMSAFRK